uniref:Uncharacterized protein n=1 Tax=Knipowitschia caucasica TaxID=637954 RepID=A0AAV2MMR6_KNICA
MFHSLAPLHSPSLFGHGARARFKVKHRGRKTEREKTPPSPIMCSGLLFASLLFASLLASIFRVCGECLIQGCKKSWRSTLKRTLTNHCLVKSP